MNPCEEYLELMMLSLDGTLEQPREAELQAHLSCCDGCRSLYETYQNIDAGIQAMEEEPPEGLTKAVMTSIRREKEKSKPAYFIKRAKFTILAAAACLALVVVSRGFDFSANTAESAETAAPETAAFLMEDAAITEVYEEDAIAEVAEETAAEEPRVQEAPVAEVYETEAETIDPEFSVGGDVSALKPILEEMESLGYNGDLVQLFDVTEQEVLERFSDCVTIVLSGGTVLYQVAWSDFDPVASEYDIGYVFSTQTIGDHAFLWLN